MAMADPVFAPYYTLPTHISHSPSQPCSGITTVAAEEATLPHKES